MRPIKLENGRWVITRTHNFVNWCAWRYWLTREVDRGFWPEKICVWSEWPPESLEGARSIVSVIVETRRQMNSDKSYCDPAEPWDRWGFREREELERRHREDFHWNPELSKFRGNGPRLVAKLISPPPELVTS